MAESFTHQCLIPQQPRDVPGLIAFWRFAASADRFHASQGEPYVLLSQSGELPVGRDDRAPLGGTALELAEGQWLHIPRRDCPKLDIHGPAGRVSVVAWIMRRRTSVPQCEFIAGQWNETHRSRQYGLFLNIRVWGQTDQVTGHLSHVGGPTPGFKYCFDGPVGATPIPCDRWTTVAMSYDGVQGFAWVNGVLDVRPGLNPYSLAGGLHDGGPGGSDFTVGAVNRSGEIGNFFRGRIAGLAVYNRALTTAEMYALAHGPVSVG